MAKSPCTELVAQRPIPQSPPRRSDADEPTVSYHQRWRLAQVLLRETFAEHLVSVERIAALRTQDSCTSESISTCPFTTLWILTRPDIGQHADAVVGVRKPLLSVGDFAQCRSEKIAAYAKSLVPHGGRPWIPHVAGCLVQRATDHDGDADPLEFARGYSAIGGHD